MQQIYTFIRISIKKTYVDLQKLSPKFIYSSPEENKHKLQKQSKTIVENNTSKNKEQTYVSAILYKI